MLRPCAIEGCDGIAGKPGSARGWCHAHYSRWQNHGDPRADVQRHRAICAIADCGKFVKSDGWCSMHHSRFLRHGSPTARLKGEVVAGRRVCPRCEVDKPLADYSPHRGTPSGLAAYCKPCYAAVAARNRKRPEFIPSPQDPAKARDYSRRWRAAHPDAIRSFCATRRARKKKATTEHFSVQEIFDRDGWICHICTDRIDPAVRYPDPMSASLDHVIPLAKGGTHSRQNCAASHLICNVRKSDRLAVAACAVSE